MYLVLKTIVNKYSNGNQYKKNVLIMVGGRAFAQALPILVSPILTRLYSPSEFGIFGVYITIVSLVAMISNGRYCLSVILARDEEDAQRLVLLSNMFTIITSILFLLFLLMFGNWLFMFLNIVELKSYIPILALNILLVGLYENLFYYVLRKKRYKILAINAITQAVALVSIRLGSGILGFTSGGLIVSFLMGYFIAYLILVTTSQFTIPLRNLKFKILLKKYINFPKYSLFTDTLSTITITAPAVLLNKAFGSIYAGYFSLSDRVLGSPVWFVTSAVGDVFKQEASEQYRSRGNCRDIYLNTVRMLLLVGLIPFTFIFIFAPYVVPVIFGSDWEPVGQFIRVLSVMYFLRFVITPVNDIAYIVNKQGYKTLFEILKLLSLVIGVLVGFWLNSVLWGLAVWTFMSTLSYTVSFFISYKLACGVNGLEKDLKFV